MQMEHRLLLSYQCHCRLKCSIRDACCTHPHSSTFTRTSRMTKNVVQISKTFVCCELQKWFQPHFLPRLAYWVSTVYLVLSNQLYSCALMYCALMSTLNWQLFRWQVYSTSLRVEAGLGGGRMLEERKWYLVSSRPQSKLDLAARARGGASSNPIQYESKEPGSCFSLFCASSWRLIMEMSGGVEEKEVYQVTPLRWVRILLWTLRQCETTLTS